MADWLFLLIVVGLPVIGSGLWLILIVRARAKRRRERIPWVRRH